MEMTTKYAVVFDYKGDWALALLWKVKEKTLRDSLELAFAEFYNLYCNYTNSDEGCEAWNEEWDRLGNPAPITNDEYYAKYNSFIAEKGNVVVKEIIDSDYAGCTEELKPLIKMLDFYVEPTYVQLHGRLKETSVDISFHIKEIK